jgi:hypothetical protein
VNMSVLIPGLTALLALVVSLLVFDQWRSRRRPYQLIWALGMLFFGIASASEALGAAGGWSEPLAKTWYLAGAVWTAGWLGLGTAFLLGRTRFGYTFAACLFLAGFITLMTQLSRHYAGAGNAAILYFIAALILAIAIGVETYFANERWPGIAALAVVGASALGLVLIVTGPLPSPIALEPVSGLPQKEIYAGTIRLLVPWLNITGGLALILGALFSAYVFMPKRRILDYSLDPHQPGDQFLFNLLISPVAITVNFVASIPMAIRALAAGRINSRVPSTILIAIGGIAAGGVDLLLRVGSTQLFELSKLVAVVLIFAGLLVSTEVFHEIRVPFTKIRLRAARPETAAEASAD